mgnify:CR=1 FL=1|tara:strand:- start:1353 stop:1490 length:138 start_codon:yes stop_codon:yes gene_type:complete
MNTINTIYSLINLIYELYPDEPEMYDCEAIIKNAQETIKQLEATQ